MKIMREKTSDIFKRLAESKKAKNHFNDPQISVNKVVDTKGFGRTYLELMDEQRETLRIQGYETVESFAKLLRMPTDVLINQFSIAGVLNLSPINRIDLSHKNILLAFLRASHGGGAKQTITLFKNETPRILHIEVVKDANDELIRLLSENPELMYGLGSRKFEEIVARLFEKRGYGVTLTPATKDGGYDFIAKLKDEMSEFLILGECKKYDPKNKVGVEIVRSLHSVVETQKACQGIIITSSFFTKGALEHQRILGARMALKDYDGLVEWLKKA